MGLKPYHAMPHKYVPDSEKWSVHREYILVKRYVSWHQVPNNLRYVECICGRAWKDHNAKGFS